MIKIILGTIVFLFLGFGSGNVFANTQIFDDGSSIQSFDDGSRLITDIDGKVTSTNATD